MKRKRKQPELTIPLTQREAADLARAVVSRDARKCMSALSLLFPGMQDYQAIQIQVELRDWLKKISQSRQASVQAARPKNGWAFLVVVAGMFGPSQAVMRRIHNALEGGRQSREPEIDDEVVSGLREQIESGTFDDRITYRVVEEEGEEESPQLSLF